MRVRLVLSAFSLLGVQLAYSQAPLPDSVSEYSVYRFVLPEYAHAHHLRSLIVGDSVYDPPERVTSHSFRPGLGWKLNADSLSGVLGLQLIGDSVFRPEVWRRVMSHERGGVLILERPSLDRRGRITMVVISWCAAYVCFTSERWELELLPGGSFKVRDRVPTAHSHF